MRPGEKKDFDCVEMMHEGAAVVQKELEGKSLEEQVTYWYEGTQALLERQQQLRKNRLDVPA